MLDDKIALLIFPLPDYMLKNCHNSITYHVIFLSSTEVELGVWFDQGREYMYYLLAKNMNNTNHGMYNNCITLQAWLWFSTINGVKPASGPVSSDLINHRGTGGRGGPFGGVNWCR